MDAPLQLIFSIAFWQPYFLLCLPPLVCVDVIRTTSVTLKVSHLSFCAAFGVSCGKIPHVNMKFRLEWCFARPRHLWPWWVWILLTVTTPFASYWNRQLCPLKKIHCCSMCVYFFLVCLQLVISLLCFNLPVIFIDPLMLIWSIKCQQVVKNGHHRNSWMMSCLIQPASHNI